MSSTRHRSAHCPRHFEDSHGTALPERHVEKGSDPALEGAETFSHLSCSRIELEPGQEPRRGVVGPTDHADEQVVPRLRNPLHLSVELAIPKGVGHLGRPHRVEGIHHVEAGIPVGAVELDDDEPVAAPHESPARIRRN